MKSKFIFALLAVALIAAGCGKSANQDQSQQTGSDYSSSSTNPTNPAKPTNSEDSTKQVANSSSSYTFAQVQSANSETKCWTIVGSNVYDVTAFIDKHPGGRDKVLSLCGKDGTEAFTKQHGTTEKAKSALAKLQIGILMK